MLTGEQIKARGLIEGLDEGSLRGTSYDLQVGEILTSDGKAHTSYVLKRQGIVKVISRERVRIPEDVAGTVIIKTSVSDKGVLALNIGLLDPLYNGRVASYLVNFSKDDQPINEGDHFLRASFHSMSSKSSYSRAVNISDSAYRKAHIERMVTGFSESFLNSEKVIEEFTDKAVKKYRGGIVTYASFAGFVLAVFVLFINFGNLFIIHRWLDPQAALKSAAIEEATTAQGITSEENSRLRKQVRQLEARLDRLERR